jgi:predicted transcriptional regulator YdeE
MQQIMTHQAEIKLVGITTRTGYKQLFLSDPSANTLVPTVQKYFHGNLAAKINNRKKPGTTFCVFANYESDYKGDYTYFIGEEVTSFSNVDKDLETLTIPAQHYAKFTSKPGPMPSVCINMWQNIWAMSPAQLGGKRAYIADFEVYDERSADHANTVLDIYIGIEK